MRKSLQVSIPFLAAAAAGCGNHAVSVHLNPAGQCVNEYGEPVDPQVCVHHGGTYGGTTYIYTSPVAPTSGSSETVRGTLGAAGEAHGAASGGEAAAGE